LTSRCCIALTAARGDPYSWGGYRGDPGIWDTLKGIGRRALGVVAGATPIGRVVSGGIQAFRSGFRRGSGLLPQLAGGPRAPAGPGGAGRGFSGGFAGPSMQFGPGGVKASGGSAQLAWGGGFAGGAGTDGVCAVKGYHTNKALVRASLPNASPSAIERAQMVKQQCVRNKHMNVLNYRAAKRAIRRIKGARRQLKRIEGALPRRPCKCRATKTRR